MNIFHREPVSKMRRLKQNPQSLNSICSTSTSLTSWRIQKILDTAPPEAVRITREALTVKDKISHIMEMLENNDTARFEDLFKEDRSRIQIVVTFVALLELIRLGLVRAYQENDFGNIWLINPQKKRNANPGSRLTAITLSDKIREAETILKNANYL